MLGAELRVPCLGFWWRVSRRTGGLVISIRVGGQSLQILKWIQVPPALTVTDALAGHGTDEAVGGGLPCFLLLVILTLGEF